MFLDRETPRRIRILGKPNDLSGWHVQVQDARTGEMIANVASATVILDPRELIVAELTYHEANDEGGLQLGPDDGPIMRKKRIYEVEIDVTALERMTLAEAVAQCFHTTYERLAPEFGYETRKESAVPWNDVPDQNKRLMIAVAAEVLQALNYNEGAAHARSSSSDAGHQSLSL